MFANSSLASRLSEAEGLEERAKRDSKWWEKPQITPLSYLNIEGKTKRKQYFPQCTVCTAHRENLGWEPGCRTLNGRIARFNSEPGMTIKMSDMKWPF